LRIGSWDAIFAEIFEHWRLRVGIPDFDEDSRVVARQLQAYGRLVVVPSRGLNGVGHQF
jgi:hypothetical protein